MAIRRKIKGIGFDEDEHGLVAAILDGVFFGLMDNREITAEASDLIELSSKIANALEEEVGDALENSDLEEEEESLFLEGFVRSAHSVVSQLQEKELLKQKTVVDTVFEYAEARWEALRDTFDDVDESDDEEELN